MLGQRYIPFGSPCPLYIAETLLGCRIRAQNKLLDVLVPVLESEPLDGAILSRRNRTRVLRIAEKVVPITEV